MSEQEPIEAWLNKYLMSRFICTPDKLPDNECLDEARVILAHLRAQYELDKVEIRREVIEEIMHWLQQYAIHGGRVPLDDVLDDLRIHSPYGKALKRG